MRTSTITSQANQEPIVVKKSKRKPYREMSLQELYNTYTKKAKNAQFRADRIKTQINNEALEGIMKRNKWTIEDVVKYLSEEH